MPRPTTQLLELAEAGANARLQDLIHEAQMLIELFPRLRDSFDQDELPCRSSRPGSCGWS